MNRIKKGDHVIVIAGKEKGNDGVVLGFNKKGDRVLVEKLNMVRRHTRPSQTNQLGGIVEKEAGIHISNVMLMTEDKNPTRIQFRTNEEGEKVRYSKKYDEYFD